MLVLHGKAVELVGTAPMEMVQPAGYRCVGNEAVSLPRADESVVASLPKVLDGKPMEVKGSLMQVGTHLRSMHVKRQASRRH